MTLLAGKGTNFELFPLNQASGTFKPKERVRLAWLLLMIAFLSKNFYRRRCLDMMGDVKVLSSYVNERPMEFEPQPLTKKCFFSH